MKQVTLRKARTAAGLTQEALEIKSGVNQATISAIEAGKVTRPAFDTVTKLAAALGLDPRALKFGQRESLAS